MKILFHLIFNSLARETWTADRFLTVFVQQNTEK